MNPLSLVLAGGLALWSLSPATVPPTTPAERQIQAAREQVASRPRDPSGHRALAVALTRRARETADATHYGGALAAIARARALGEPGADLDTVEAWVRQGQHEFARAETLARRALARSPDDPTALGVLGDALIEQGRYDEAALAYQRALALRPGPAAFVRGASYREVTGDLEGALALFADALAATPLRESEERAWIQVQMAGVERARGRAASAGELHRAALGSFPGYATALSGLAQLALEAGDAARAESLAREAFAAAPHPERRLAWADALRALGREREAREQETLFEQEALANRERPDNENLHLVDFYLDRRPAPQRALAIAKREAARREDVATLGRLARAYQATGDAERARALRARLQALAPPRAR